MRLLAQSIEAGCRTHLRACTDPLLDAQHFLEPKFKIFGAPVPKPFRAQVCDVEAANRVVAVLEQLTGVRLTLEQTQC